MRGRVREKDERGRVRGKDEGKVLSDFLISVQRL